MSSERLSGILLHPTSLPGNCGTGSFGAEARQFIDFLHAAGQRLWQVLPLGPTGYGNSPYSCYSAFAGNPLLINLELIADEGDLLGSDLVENLPRDRVDFAAVSEVKTRLLKLAAERFIESDNLERKREFWQFCDSTFWLHDYALYKACKDHFHGKPWNRWPLDLARRSADAVARYSERLGVSIGEQKYIQWQFFRQWHNLKQYANACGVRIIGDAPIFVAYDSADVWCNQPLFRLDGSGKPLVVAGVPPDYFSATGQRWGNPLYDWDRMAEDGFGWWVARLKSDMGLYDFVRIDHFRGVEAFWEISAKEKTAVHGRWVKGPGDSLFNAIGATLGPLPLIAEDLGVITPEVETLRDRFGLPGMKILQFAFEGGPGNPYLPHNYRRNSVVYTGTHDNDTTAGWFASLTGVQKAAVCSYLRCKQDEVVWEMIRAAISSVARYAVIPLQDLLCLDSSARMNVPGSASGNWSWRLLGDQLSDGLAVITRNMSKQYNRCS
ncbi:4-alpha-glucanotransferase [Geobacter pelophilus]|uniref:4-alpha-glucanotransferase n=1 Tax=Geoanaerobacter pelophilus TaxID=60036 RepID=A0AAW4L8Y3_9BACT|nr:4-alpha-glucanotransferase [Geoanaerobacter pelophilus]MBT0666602.1 4-alpha-glucanotransferase [Geoanaerobacter pelophilus]